MAKKYKFDLTVDSTALLQANPTEFYARLFGMESASNNYRVIPNVKNATKVANVLFDQVTQAGACDFSATNSTVSAITVDVCGLMINTSLCQYELESAWLADSMTPGSNSDITGGIANFMSYFWEQFANKAHEELAVLMWQGDTAGATGTYLDGATGTYLDECDGWLKRICGLSPIRATQTTVTTGNVIAEMGECLQLLPNEVNRAQVEFKVSQNIADVYRIATATTNTITNVTEELALTYLGIPIKVEYGLPDNTMLLGDKNNFLFVTDLEGDVDSLEVVDFSKTTLDRRVGARADYKVGFYIVNDTQIVFYGDCTAS
jgi:hypothetical protein